jgi:PAB1-binding protein PBP1
LEQNGSGGGWDQFAENERLFGLKSDYDENMYTTVINKSHPQYRERKAIADKMAQEIERSLPATAHVAEERIMDFVPGSQRGDDKENEEDK